MAKKILLGVGCLALAPIALGLFATHRKERVIALTCYGALYKTGKYQGVQVSDPIVKRAIDDSRTAYTVDWGHVSVRNERGELEPPRRASCITWGEIGDWDRWDARAWFVADQPAGRP